MSIGFEIIHGSTVILQQKVVFKQSVAYHYRDEIYAKAAGGFVKLKLGGGTTHADIKWLELDGVKGTKQPKHAHGFVEYKQ